MGRGVLSVVLKCTALVFVLEAGASAAPQQQSTESAPTGHICFKNHQNGLPWPIGNARDIGTSIFHASHCFDEVTYFLANKETRIGKYLHTVHCRGLLKLTLKFFKENPDYKIPSVVCNDLVDLGTCDRSAGPCYGMSNLSPLESLRNPEAVERTHPKEPALSSEVDAQALYPDLAAGVKDQRQLQISISSENIDQVFYRYWTKKNVTDAEQKYVQSWNQPSVLRLSALGLYCREGKGSAPIEKLEKLLAALPQEDYHEM